MYKIGEFSVLAKTTIKTLRFYEKQGIFLPSFIGENNYRYYDGSKLLELSNIVALRQIGFSIEEIKKVNNGVDISTLLRAKLAEVEQLQIEYTQKISKIKYLLGEKNMDYKAIIKELPEYYVYYKEGIIKTYDEVGEFILGSAEECLKANPSRKCIEPDYCFLEYLDGEYKEKDIKVRYSQAVEKAGVNTETIKFKKLTEKKAVCIYHKGSYANLSKAYSFILNYIAENKLEIVAPPRERYIDGVWNKESEDDYLTEIQFPIK